MKRIKVFPGGAVEYDDKDKHITFESSSGPVLYDVPANEANKKQYMKEHKFKSKPKK